MTEIRSHTLHQSSDAASLTLRDIKTTPSSSTTTDSAFIQFAVVKINKTRNDDDNCYITQETAKSTHD